MLDIHNHMLPGLDDGPPDWDQSLALARLALAGGIREVVCTPHWVPGAYRNTRQVVLSAVEQFRRKLREAVIPLKVYPGAELRLAPDLPQRIESGELLTLNDTGRFALIELPDICLMQNLEVFFRNMLDRGITPVICHPERNHSLMQDPMPLFRWVESGCHVQLTSASVIGRFGAEVRDFSLVLLTHRLVHILGTDAHSLRLRAPVLRDSWEKVRDILGQEAADLMVNENPGRIIAGESIDFYEPVPFAATPPKVSFSRKIFSFLGFMSHTHQ